MVVIQTEGVGTVKNLSKKVMKNLNVEVDPFTDDAMIQSITDEMKQIKVDPNFKIYNIIQENPKGDDK